jgi:hypothetical protein
MAYPMPTILIFDDNENIENNLGISVKMNYFKSSHSFNPPIDFFKNP